MHAQALLYDCARLQEQYESGSSSDKVPTTVVMNSVNCNLLASGKATLSSVDVSRLVRLAFGSTVERKSARVQGCRSCVYCGIRKKSDHEASPPKRPCIQESSKDITSPTSDHLVRITQLEAELKREKKRGQNLEAELQQSIIQSQSIQCIK